MGGRLLHLGCGGAGGSAYRTLGVLFKLLASLASTAAGGTTGAKLDNERKKIEGRCDPRKRQHTIAEFGFDIELVRIASEDILEDDEHNRCDCGGDNREKGG